MPDSNEKSLADQFKDGLDKDGAVKLAQRVADLETANRDLETTNADLKKLVDESGDSQAKVADLQGQLEASQRDTTAANSALEGLRTENASLMSANETLAGELADARQELDKANQKLTAKPKAATPKAAATKVRKFPEIADESRLEPGALTEAIANADDVEIAFIDDRGREIPGTRPVEIQGDVWKDIGRGLMLTLPLDLQGGQDAGYAIAGYVLVADGKQIAQVMRPDPVNVAAGTKVRLVEDIIF